MAKPRTRNTTHTNTTHTANAANTTARAPHAAAPAVPTITEGSQGSAALARLQPQFIALAPSQVVPITVDIGNAVRIILGSIPRIIPYRDAAARLDGFDIVHFDELRERALAAECANVRYLASIAPHGELPELLIEATGLRDRFAAALNALAVYGLCDPAQIRALSNGYGYQATAENLMALASLLTANWPRAHGRVPVTQDEIHRAGVLGEQILMLNGEREFGASPTLPAADLRRRAYTLMDQSHDQVRRALSFIRWSEGDVDTIAPSIHRQSGSGRRRAQNDTPEPGDTSDAAGTAAATPTAPTADNTAHAPSTPVTPASLAGPPVPHGRPVGDNS